MTWSSNNVQTPSGEVAPWSWQDLDSSGRGQDALKREAVAREIDAAYGKGLSDGEDAGFARARQELSTALRAVRAALQEVRAARATWDRTLEENLVALAAAIARKIVDRELADSGDALRELVRKAASSYPAEQAVRIRMHPDDLALLAGPDGRLASSDDPTGGREVRWIADEVIERGGCLVEGPDRIVDGRVDKALERLYWELTHG
jgi:flagellar biosynthesis/type III secretory pathway protein FliH